MRYLALVTDYDGVVATDGRPSAAAVSALERVRASGRRVVLNTGRRLADLLECCSDPKLFDYVVAENGAIGYDPRSREETPLGKAPPAAYVARLRELGVDPLEVGRVIVATRLPHHTAVIQAIQELGLELHVIFNRSSVMVLPAGVNKAAGMEYALRRLGLSTHEVVAVGDSENDHSFLERSECAATVANAVPSIREMAALVARAENGAGLAEIVDTLVGDDLGSLDGRTPQRRIAIGRREDGSLATIAPYGPNLLVAGPSASGKSTFTAGLVERLVGQTYQVCIVDPEGDYSTLAPFITVGHHRHAVSVNEVLALLEDPVINLNVNLLGIPLADRPAFFTELFTSLQAMRTRTGRPHWIILDEAHHLLPAQWGAAEQALPYKLGETVFITVHPDHLAPAALARVDAVVAIGPSPGDTLAEAAQRMGRVLAWPKGLEHEPGKAVVWFPDEPPFRVGIMPGTEERLRHLRKYAEGDMRERSFVFRGPGGRHALKAQNLTIFGQIAGGIDEETWAFHLRRGDYSRWFLESVKDAYLAEQTEAIERRRDLSPAEARRLILGLVEARYTLPE